MVNKRLQKLLKETYRQFQALQTQLQNTQTRMLTILEVTGISREGANEILERQYLAQRKKTKRITKRRFA